MGRLSGLGKAVNCTVRMVYAGRRQCDRRLEKSKRGNESDECDDCTERLEIRC